MNASDKDFLAQLREIFRIEAEEHLQVIVAGLLQLEQTGAEQARQAIVEATFRAAHSLKGAARAAEFSEVESICQWLETTFSAWKNLESVPSAKTLDVLHTKLDRIAALVRKSGEAATSASPGGNSVTSAPRDTPAASAPLVTPPPAARPAAETVRISVDVLDERMIEAEEMLVVKLASARRVEALREIAADLKTWRGSLREQDQEYPKALERQLEGLTRAAEHDRAATDKLVSELLANSKKLLLMPFASVSAPLPKLVRDLCREQGKEADLKVDGEHIPVDKRILDAIKDPLNHLLRNCVDHGVEMPTERERRGKSPRAQIRLSVAHAPGNTVCVTLTDDGAGIDTQRVKAAAVRRGLLSAADAAGLPDAEARALVFSSGLSTSPVITELSGRGLGLAIVQEKAVALGGEAHVESVPGGGTTFRIIVPALRATFRGITVRTAGHLVVLPTTQVQRVTRVRDHEIARTEGRWTVRHEDRWLPVCRLSHVLELPESVHGAGLERGATLVVIGRGEQAVAFAVDRVLDEQELLVKPLLPPLARVRNIASATVLPTGQVALILHVPDLLRSAHQSRAMAAGVPQRPAAGAAPLEKAILVAEDSITSRTLIKGILESSGYRVVTAVDGMEALNRLRSQPFDLLVSDVEMPRLNGFDLAAAVRADDRLAQLPIVLVTALERREDRERGVDVGANAYIVKSSFDQTTLLDAVRRLT